MDSSLLHGHGDKRHPLQVSIFQSLPEKITTNLSRDRFQGTTSGSENKVRSLMERKQKQPPISDAGAGIMRTNDAGAMFYSQNALVATQPLVGSVSKTLIGGVPDEVFHER